MCSKASHKAMAESPPRRRFRIPLSAKIVAVLVLTGIGGVAWIGGPIGCRQLVIWEIERAGGSVRVESWKSGTRGRDWLRAQIGNPWMRPFDDVGAITLVSNTGLA